MDRPFIKLVLRAGAIAAVLCAPGLGPESMLGSHRGGALAEPADGEKEAFEAAKELGTVEAWDAFLANYSTGFHADLARAYVKKLSGESQAALPPPDDYPVVAGSWGGIVRDGPGQSYDKVDSLDEGAEVTLMARSDVVWNGYPWFKIAFDKGGRGYMWGGILCSVEDERPDLFKTCPEKAAKTKPESKPRSVSREEPKACGRGRVRINGKCMKKSAAVSFCGPGYRPQGGKCVKGYKAPSANAPLSTQQKKAVNRGCPKGQVWNAQEGCHEDD